MSDYFEELSRHKHTQGSLKQTSDATGLSCTNIKRVMIRINLIVLMTNSSRHSQSFFFDKVFLRTLVTL